MASVTASSLLAVLTAADTLGGSHAATLTHGLRERVEKWQAVLPADARVGDAHAVLQRLPGDEVLPPGLEMALHHDTEDALVTAGHLPGNVATDGDLALMLLLA